MDAGLFPGLGRLGSEGLSERRCRDLYDEGRPVPRGLPRFEPRPVGLSIRQALPVRGSGSDVNWDDLRELPVAEVLRLG